jgi:hypothetical protein
MRSLARTAPLLLSAVLITPTNGLAAGASTPSLSSESSKQGPPAYQKKSHAKKRNQKSSSIDDFIAGYKAAYALIYDKSDYEAGIAALRALDRDDNPDVATLLRPRKSPDKWRSVAGARLRCRVPTPRRRPPRVCCRYRDCAHREGQIGGHVARQD